MGQSREKLDAFKLGLSDSDTNIARPKIDFVGCHATYGQQPKQTLSGNSYDSEIPAERCFLRAKHRLESGGTV